MAFAKASNKALTQKVGALLLSIHNIIASFFLCFLIDFAITKAVLDDCVTLFDNQKAGIFLDNGKNSLILLDFPAERCYNFSGYQVNSPHRVANSAKEIVILYFPQ